MQSNLKDIKNLDKVKLIAIDVDGTTLDDDGKFPENLFPTMRELLDLGVKICIASGRPKYNLQELFSQLSSDLILASDNGAEVVKGDQELYHNAISRAEVGPISEFVNKHDHHAVYEGSKACYTHKKYLRYRKMLEFFFSRVEFVESLDNINEDFNKISVVFPLGNSKPALDNLYAPEFSDKYEVTSGGKVWLDLGAKNVSKGLAVRYLQDSLGISKAETLVIADNYNDISMLEEADFSFAVDNAVDDIKAQANYVAPSNNEAAVVKVMQAVLAAKVK